MGDFQCDKHRTITVSSAACPYCLAKLRAENERLREALEDVSKTPGEALEVIKHHGFVFDGNGGAFEALAFTLYNMLIESGQAARAALESSE